MMLLRLFLVNVHTIAKKNSPAASLAVEEKNEKCCQTQVDERKNHDNSIQIEKVLKTAYIKCFGTFFTNPSVTSGDKQSENKRRPDSRKSIK